MMTADKSTVTMATPLPTTGGTDLTWEGSGWLEGQEVMKESILSQTVDVYFQCSGTMKGSRPQSKQEVTSSGLDANASALSLQQ